MRLSILFILLFSCSLFAQPGSFSARGIGGGGALFFPSINPADDKDFYVSCDMSQLFHSTDFGASYTQLHFNRLQVFGAFSTYEYTNDPNIAYSNFNDGNEGFPVKTINGGLNWIQLSGYDLNNYGQVYKMSANYHNPQQFLINSYGHILFSKDGGLSFSLVRQAANNGAGLIMAGVFWEGANIYIGTNEGVLVSNNSGASFSLMNASGMDSGQVIWSFAGAKSGNTTRFVCIASDIGDTYNGLMPWEYYNHAKGVYTMDNANGIWTPKSNGINFSNDFLMYAAMAWNDVNTFYLGGSDASKSAALVYKTTDVGASWTNVFQSDNNANIRTGWSGAGGDKNWSWGETCFGLSVAPNNSNKLMFGDFGFVHLSSDGGTNWKQAYVSVADEHPAGAPTPKNKAYHSVGIENTTCWQIDWSSETEVMACFSDIGGIRSVDGGNSWGFQYSGFSVNSLYRIAKGSNGMLYGACSKVHDMYQSTRLADAQLDASDNTGKIVMSSDKGATWTTLHTFNHPVFWLATDPNQPERMYASVIHYGGTQGAQQGGIYQTDNLSAGAASTWSKLPNPPRTEGHPACIVVLHDGKVLCTFSGRRGASGFTASSGVFLYDPTSNSWKDLSDPGMLYWTKDIVPDPTDPQQNTWYAGVFSGWGGAPNGLGGLYRTHNRGQSWTKLTGTQFDRVTSLSFNPQKPEQAYLTTETQGLWVTPDIQASTPVWTLVNAYPFRQPERVFFNPFHPEEMWVTSFGNGLKVGKMSVSGLSFTPTEMPDFKLYPNPASDMIYLEWTNKPEGQPEFVYICNALGQTLLSQPLTATTTPVSTQNWPCGLYFARVGKQIVRFSIR